MFYHKLCAFFVLVTLKFVTPNNEINSAHDIQNALAIVNNNFGLNFMKHMQETKSSVKNDKLCANQTAEIISGITEFEIWALQFIDSWGKIPPGILMGHLKQIGNFDECLSISKKINDKPNIGTIRGKHCMISFPTKKIINLINEDIKVPDYLNMQFPGMDLGMGICLPEICSIKFIDQSLKNYIENKTELKINFSLINGECIKYDDIYTDFDAIDWVAIIFFSVIAIIILLSTIYDYITRIKVLELHGKAQNQLLISFSVITNGEKLFKIQNIKSPNVIECLNGMRCLSMVWIVYVHSLMSSASLNNINTFEMFQFLNEFSSMMFLQGGLAVDTFFFLSGFLLMWAVCKEMDRTNGKLNILMMYVHRYIRLTPIVAVIILFSASFSRHIGAGPFWKVNEDTFIKPCQENWWVTLLYVQNYVNVDRPCLSHAWYLSVDTQLFFFSPLIVIPLYKWGKKFIPVIVILALLSIGCVFGISLKHGYGLGIMGGGRSMVDRDFMKLIYKGTHARYSPWLVGILLAYVMYKTRNKKIRMRKIFVIIGWLISLGIMMAVIFGPYNRMQKNAQPYSDVEAAFYGSLHRFSWSIGLAWLVFACQTGYGGIINSMLSFSIWQPFGRLTYSIYLVHYTLQFILNANNKTEVHFSNYDILIRFWSDFGLSLTISLITVLAFELPILGLENVLFKKAPTKHETKPKLETIIEPLEKNF